MQRPPFPLLVALLLLAIAVGGWWWLSRTAPAPVVGTAESVAPDAPAPPSATVPAVAEPREERVAGDETARQKVDPRVAKLLARFAQSQERGKISRAVVDAFVEAQGGSAASLLAAWEESGDERYLRAAAERFADDPAVQLAVILSPAFAEERAAWIARFQQSAPDNPLGGWLTAWDAFKSGRKADAVAAMIASAGHTQFDSYALVAIQARYELFRAAGFDPVLAQIEALFGLRLGHLQPVQETMRQVTAETAAARGRADAATAVNLAAAALSMGRAIAAAPDAFLIDQLVGISMETAALKKLAAAEAARLLGSPAENRLAELTRQKDEIKALSAAGDITSGSATYEQLTEYLHRVQTEGELAAQRWMAGEREKAKP